MAGTRKGTYKITNWSKYNESLVQRGSITFWFCEETIEKWRHDNANPGVGHPFVYSDTAVECLLVLRELFQLPYRQTEGLGKSLVELMQIELDIPDYTSLAKRAAKLGVSLDIAKHSGRIDVVVDSTGLKVFGEGEWKMRKHGKSKRRTWRKLHLAVNPDTHEIEAETLTENSCDDASQVDDLLDQVTSKIGGFYGDGAYDKCKIYETLGETQHPSDHSAAAEREDLAARQFGRTSVVAGRGDPRNPPPRPPTMEGASRLSSPKPFGNGHVSDEMLLWRPSEKPRNPKPTNRNATTKQNPQQVHPPRTPTVRVELVNKALHCLHWPALLCTRIPLAATLCWQSTQCKLVCQTQACGQVNVLPQRTDCSFRRDIIQCIRWSGEVKMAA